MATLVDSYTTASDDWWPISSEEDSWDDSLAIEYVPSKSFSLEEVHFQLSETGTLGAGSLWEIGRAHV